MNLGKQVSDGKAGAGLKGMMDSSGNNGVDEVGQSRQNWED